MFRSVFRRLDGDLTISHINNSHLNPIFNQIVRWRRKPRWLPTARTKVFRIPERKKLPVQEYEDLKRLFNNYRTEMKSIRSFFAQQMSKTTYVSDNKTVISVEEEEEELKKCFEINDKWNAEVRKIREETLAKEKEEELENILRTVEENKIIMEERKKEIEEIVRKEKERAHLYITAQNIDEAIDMALENEVDYHFAIDLDGNFFHGRNTKPPKSPISPEAADLKVEQSSAAAIA